jgi:hypothetical protein
MNKVGEAAFMLIMGAIWAHFVFRAISRSHPVHSAGFPIQTIPDFPTGHPAHEAWLN